MPRAEEGGLREQRACHTGKELDEDKEQKRRGEKRGEKSREGKGRFESGDGPKASSGGENSTPPLACHTWKVLVHMERGGRGEEM